MARSLLVTPGGEQLHLAAAAALPPTSTAAALHPLRHESGCAHARASDAHVAEDSSGLFTAAPCSVLLFLLVWGFEALLWWHDAAPPPASPWRWLALMVTAAGAAVLLFAVPAQGVSAARSLDACHKSLRMWRSLCPLMAHSTTGAHSAPAAWKPRPQFCSLAPSALGSCSAIRGAIFGGLLFLKRAPLAAADDSVNWVTSPGTPTTNIGCSNYYGPVNSGSVNFTAGSGGYLTFSTDAAVVLARGA